MEEYWIYKAHNLKIKTLDFTVSNLLIIFLDNSALIGGVIKATNSIVKLTDSLFEYNIAYYGGVIQIDNEA